MLRSKEQFYYQRDYYINQTPEYSKEFAYKELVYLEEDRLKKTPHGNT